MFLDKISQLSWDCASVEEKSEFNISTRITRVDNGGFESGTAKKGLIQQYLAL